MLLFKKGGSLDRVTSKGLTPLAFGSQSLLSFLSLETGVTLVSPELLKMNKDLERAKRLESFEGLASQNQDEAEEMSELIGNNRLFREKIFGKGVDSKKALGIRKNKVDLSEIASQET